MTELSSTAIGQDLWDDLIANKTKNGVPWDVPCSKHGLSFNMLALITSCLSWDVGATRYCDSFESL